MKNKKNNLAIAVGSLIAIITLAVGPSRIHKIFFAGSTVSVMDFYLICVGLGMLLCLYIIMYNDKKDAVKDNDLLYENITKEYKEYVNDELKTIKLEITQIKEEINKITPAMKDELDTLKEVIADNTKEILGIYKNK